ncbi:MAG: hypothetical protein IIC85_14265 [Chloroflexi bacterium]|nr:hypothetical protein [Chloroflexota bacterium]
MIDEDPGKLQPSYLRQITPLENLTHLGLKTYVDNSRNNRIVLICPELEGWILRAVRDSGLRMDTYNLPDRSTALKRVINARLDNLSRLLADLNDADSPRLHRLKELLN